MNTVNCLVVGVYRNKTDIVGFKLIRYSDHQQFDISYANTCLHIKNGSLHVQNLELVNGQLKFIGGAESRYDDPKGIVNKLVILDEVYDRKTGALVFYDVASAIGKVTRNSVNTILNYAIANNKKGINVLANAKLINKNGKYIISSIEGTYPILSVDIPRTPVSKPATKPEATKPEATKPEATKPEATKQTDANSVSQEVVDKIRKCMSYPDFHDSFAEKVSLTIKKFKKCSPKQEAVLDRFINEHKDEEVTVRRVEPVEDEIKEVPKVDQKKPEVEQKKPEVEQKKPEVAEVEVSKPTPVKSKVDTYDANRIIRVYSNYQTVSNNDLTYKVTGNTNEVYVARLLNHDLKNIIIPDDVAIDGKTYDVVGITSGAFANEDIKSIKCGPKMRDIGPGAFEASHIEFADLSDTKITLIASRTFLNCRFLKYVKLNNLIERIHEYAFAESSLESITLPDTTMTISAKAFENCKNLQSVNAKPKFVNDGAFCGDRKLSVFDFSNINSIAPFAFCGCAFEEIEISESTVTIGSKAFLNNLELSKVNIKDGVSAIGDNAFFRIDFGRRGVTDIKLAVGKPPKDKKLEITVPKSVKEIGHNAFGAASLVYTYTGSYCESYCNGYSVPCMLLDSANTENTTAIRRKSAFLGTSPMQSIYNRLSANAPDAANPEYSLRYDKLTDIDAGAQLLKALKVPIGSNPIDPSIKFKAIVNYLQDVSDYYKDPLTNEVLRLSRAFNIHNEVLYTDSWNSVNKVSYEMMDTLDKGSFIMVTSGTKLLYVSPLAPETDILVNPQSFNDEALPINGIIHSGDKLGRDGVIASYKAYLGPDEHHGYIDVGILYANKLFHQGIGIRKTRKDYYLYVPCENIVLYIHDDGKNIEENFHDRDERDIGTLTIVQMISYAEFINEVKDKIIRSGGDDRRFFDTVKSFSNTEINNRITSTGLIQEEKQAQLFRISKAFNEIVIKAGDARITPNYLAQDLFDGLCNSYWMVPKDSQWLRLAKSKSLNKIDEYNIGNYRIIEYRSNQVVKFSNPYMNGCKGAYIFVKYINNREAGVYASVMSLSEIATELVNLTRFDQSIPVVDLMQNAEELDMVDPKLFYSFYNVLYTSDGWLLEDYSPAFRSIGNSVSFHISMYKPTGVFYLTANLFATRTVIGRKGTETKTVDLRTIPILPIGNMNRALMVANTTNINASKLKLFNELIELALIMDYKINNLNISEERLKYCINSVHDIISRRYKNMKFDVPDESAYVRYIKAREMSIEGIKDAKEYKKIIDDRAVYMMGTVSKGQLKVENYKSYDFDSDTYDEDQSFEEVIDNDDDEYDESEDENEYGQSEYEIDFDEDGEFEKDTEDDEDYE